MAGSLNRVILIGNVGKDPEIRSTQDGRQIANFTMATTETWRDRMTGEKRDKTEWHNIVIFSEGLTKVVQNYVKKGSKLYIEGQLQTRKWQDKEGHDRYTTEIILQNFNSNLILLDSRNNSGGNNQDSYDSYGSSSLGNAGSSFGQMSSGGGNANSPSRSFAHELDDDIPF